jgi:hypothetical protein
MKIRRTSVLLIFLKRSQIRLLEQVLTECDNNHFDLNRWKKMRIRRTSVLLIFLKHSQIRLLEQVLTECDNSRFDLNRWKKMNYSNLKRSRIFPRPFCYLNIVAKK